jgi:ketosteroid isomerase-like protein
MGQDRSAEGELRAAMAERLKASIEGDTEKIASSMTDDYLQTDISGYVQDKATWLNEYFKPLAELIKAGKFRWEVYERKDEQVRIYGDCAVVIGALDLKGSGARPTPQHTWVAAPNASFSGTLRFTHVYVKRKGKWLLAVLHNQLPQAPPPTHN